MITKEQIDQAADNFFKEKLYISFMHTFRGGAEWALTQYDWVSMNDKNSRPVHDQKILLWTSFFDHPEYRRWHKDWNNDDYIDYYYMPLPEPPKTEQP